MTAPKFRANYQELQQIASRFKGESDRASQTMRSLKGNVEVLRGGDWIGQGARKFYEEMDGQVFPTVNRLIAAMAEAQKVTMQISQIAQQAEADAAKILDKEPGEGGAPAAQPGGAPAGGGNDGGGLWDRFTNWAKEKWDQFDKSVVKFVVKKVSSILADKLGLAAIKKTVTELMEQGAKIGLKNIAKIIPIPVVDLVLDLAANTAANVYEYWDKGLFKNPEFWGTMMKDSTISVGVWAGKWIAMAALAPETLGAGSLVADVAAGVVGFGIDKLFGKQMTDFYTEKFGRSIAEWFGGGQSSVTSFGGQFAPSV
jgi:WXG100 family type VII secretion target